MLGLGPNGPSERKSFTSEDSIRKCMTTKKNTKKRSGAKKSVSSQSSKKGGRKKSNPRSPGIISRAKKVVREVLTGAVAGAATGAVVGAADAGTKAAGIGESTKKKSKGNRSAKR